MEERSNENDYMGESNNENYHMEEQTQQSPLSHDDELEGDGETVFLDARECEEEEEEASLIEKPLVEQEQTPHDDSNIT